MYQGILKYTDNSFYNFSTESKAAEYLGVASYNCDSLKKYFSDKGATNECYRILSGDCDSKDQKTFADLEPFYNKMTGQEKDVTGNYGIYRKFNESTNTYIQTAIDIPLCELGSKHDDNQNKEQVDEEIAAIVLDVQNSLNSSIEFFPFNSGEPYYMHFYARTPTSKSKRTLALNGEPSISATPRRPTGGKYHYLNTLNDRDAARIGHYSSPPVANLDNTAAAEGAQRVVSKLRLSYNEGLSRFESGTQIILARLVSDIDPAELAQVDMTTIDDAESNTLYDPESDFFLSQFTTGVAVPMNAHYGNPNLFGPNIVDSNTFKKEKIRVVNRSGRAFKQNDVVFCMLIGNEWIISDFGESEMQRAGIKFGKWSFSKMIANSDAYFKDDRFASQGEKYRSPVQENGYAEIMKTQFYLALNAVIGTKLDMDGLNDTHLLAKLNAVVTKPVEEVNIDEAAFPDDLGFYDFVPSKQYVQTTSFDQMSNSVGGNNKYNWYGRTNMFIPPTPDSPSIAEYARDLGIFWGVNLLDGYTSGRVLGMKGEDIDVQYLGDSLFFGTEASVNIEDSSNDAMEIGMFEDPRDFNFYQMPADIALNASPSGEFGSPIEGISRLAYWEANSENILHAYNNFLNDPVRFSWIAHTDSASNSLYDLQPITKNRLSFIPLSFDVLEGIEEIKSGANLASGLGDFTEEEVWGELLTRESLYTQVPFHSEVNDAAVREDEQQSVNMIPWDTQIVQDPKASNHNQIYRFMDNDSRGESYNGANVMAISACKTTLKIGGDTSIELTSTFRIGLPAHTTISGGQVTPPTILPIGGGLVFGGGTNQIRQHSFPQWGNRGDTAITSLAQTLLRASLYDHWPQQNTIYDVRYNAPLHFNPGPIAFEGVSTIKKDEGISANLPEPWNPPDANSAILANIEYEREVDVEEYETDFRIPTIGHPDDASIDNSIVQEGALINRYGVATGTEQADTTAILRPKSEWRVNPICRGMMLSGNHGFRYLRRTIGLDTSNFTIVNKGTGFQAGQEVETTRGIIVEVTQISSDGGIDAFNIKGSNGYDFDPASFGSTDTIETGGQLDTIFGYKLAVPSDNGSPASIMFHTGKVYSILEETDYAKNHGHVLCTPPSRGDDGALEGSKTVNLAITEPNKSRLYNLYLFHANDVGHVDLSPQTQTAGFLQYLNLDIGAT